MAVDLVTSTSGDATVAGSLGYELAHAAAGDTIDFVSDVSTIDLSTTLAIVTNVTIEGAGKVTIDGGGTVTDILVATGTTATLDGLTIQNGNGVTAGGIYVQGTLNLSNSLITSNKATGVSGAAGSYGQGGYAGYAAAGGIYVAAGGSVALQKATNTFGKNSAIGGTGGTGGYSAYSDGIGAQSSLGYSGGLGGAGGTSSSGMPPAVGSDGTSGSGKYGGSGGGPGQTGGSGTFYGGGPNGGYSIGPGGGGGGGIAYGDYGGAGSIFHGTTISNRYTTGYQLKASYDSLTVASTAVVGGAGISTAAATQTIVNNGTVHGTRFGITLSDGGTITNTTIGNTKATIEAQTAILAKTDYAVIQNGAVIKSDAVTSTASAGTMTAASTSIILQAGGNVENAAGATISNGISISGGIATIDNLGTIGGTTSFTTSPSGTRSATTIGYALTVSGGGEIANGGSTGAIMASSEGITLRNSGRISADSNGVSVNFAGAGSELIENSGAILAGRVLGGGGMLYLDASGQSPGTISGIGSTITGFNSIYVDNGWTFGATTIAKGTSLYNDGQITAINTLTLDGTLHNLGTLTNSGTLTLAGQVVSSGGIYNLKGKTLDFDGDFSITTDPTDKYSGGFSNAGVIEKTAGTGTSIIRTSPDTVLGFSLTDSGTINVETGTIELTGATVTVSGVIEGVGEIEFGPGVATLSAGTSLTTSDVILAGSGAQLKVAADLSYDKAFIAGVSTVLTINKSEILTLSGAASFLRDTIDGAGQVITDGASSVSIVTLGGTANWDNAGTLTETGTLTLGDAAGNTATFINEAKGVDDLEGAVGIAIGKSTKAKFTNQGLLEKTAGAASVVSIGIVNTGTIAAASGTLDFQGTVTGSGKATITNKAILEFDGSVALGTAVSFGTGGGTLLLKAAPSFAGTIASLGAGDTLDVGNFVATGYSYTVNSQKSGGTLKLTNGSTTESLKLVGTYASTGFHLTKGKSGDTLVTYATPSSSEHPTAVEPQPVVQPVGSHDAHMNALTAALFDGAFAPSMTTEKFAMDMDHHYAQAAVVASAGPGHR